MKLKYLNLILLSLLLCNLYSQDNNENIEFNDIAVIKSTPVKSQYFTGTCWNFATLSFIESELIRLKNEEFNLSEKFLVRYNYIDRSDKYIQTDRKCAFQQGGQAHDAILTMKKTGIVPEEVYPMNKNDNNTLVHFELSNALLGMLDGVQGKSRGKITDKYPLAVEKVMDAYLGEAPSEFYYHGRKYTPKSFYDEKINIDLNNYFEITSMDNKPYYESITLEIPDNWRQSNYYNIPLDELAAVVKNSINTGYSVVWDGDVTQDNYDVNKTVYKIELEEKFQDQVLLQNEIKKIRQEYFNTGKTTDDHLMHLIGISKDKNNKVYFKLKDSAGENHPYVYISEPYFMLSTVAIMVNKNALPADTAKKLKLN